MSVIGYDIGNQNCVIAVTRKRGIDVIANEASRRTTACMAGFQGHARQIGEAASVGRMRNLKNTVSSVKRFLGRKFADEDVQREIQRVPFKVVEGPDGGILLDVMYGDGRESFTPEQVMAMILSKLQETVVRETKTQGGACVISVPSNWTDAQRRAMRDSAAIAGINCLRLVSENCAAGLHYGFYKQGLSDSEPVYFMLFDMGHSSLTVSILSLTKAKLSVVSTVTDPWLGGREFDLLLAEHFATEFAEKYKLPVKENARAWERLLTSCEKLKTVLSANPKAPLNIECLMNDVDVRSVMDRDDFLKMAEPLLAGIESPVQRCIELARAQLGDSFTPDLLETVEVIGGASRIPAVQSRLSNILGGRELSHTLDKSETISKGCALMCAILSPQFRVRDFKVEDSTPYGVRVSWGSVSAPDQVEDSAVLFTKFNAMPSTKNITFQRNTGMFISASYEKPEELPDGTNPHIGRWDIGPIPSLALPDKAPKIKVKVKLDLFGIIKVESATMTELLPEEPEPEPEPDTKPMDVEGEGEGAAAAKEGAGAEGGEDASAEKKKEEPTAEAPAAPKKKVRHTELRITPMLTYTHTEKVKLFYEREGQMAAQDRLIVETGEAKNDVESYVYDTRSKIGEYGVLHDYTSEEEETTFRKLLDDTENWLYEDGEDATKSVYVAKLKELKAIGDPIETRRREDLARPEAIAAVEAAIAEFRELAASPDPKYEHIDEAERKKVTDKCNEIEQWLVAERTKQDALSKKQNPTLFATTLRAKKDEIGWFCRPIMNKPKPAPKKEEKPATPPENGASAENGDAAAKENGGASADGSGSGASGDKDGEPMVEEVKENGDNVDMEVD